MKCKVCNYAMNPGMAKCPKCGFPVLQMVKGDGAEEKRMKELADKFRKKKVETVKIWMTVCTNTKVNDKVNVAKEENILLARGEQLLKAPILWYPEKFARLSGNCRLKLSIVHTDGRCEKKDVLINNPNINDFWSVGIMPLDGMEFRVVLGNEKTYSSSDKFSFL